MGLQEKRALKAFQDDNYPKLMAEINTAAGYEPELDVQWDTLAEADYSHLYEEGFTKVFFNPLIRALKDITSDDLGKEALQDTLKKVVIKNEKGTSNYDNTYSFASGVLTIDHKPFSNIDEIDGLTKAVTKVLMDAL